MGTATGARSLLLLATLLAAAWEPTEAARILGVFGHIGKSHWDVFEPLMQELARRGHHVLVISHFPQSKPLTNYTDISLVGTVTEATPVGTIVVDDMKLNTWVDVWYEHMMLSGWSASCCEAAFSHPEVQQLLRSGRKFDLLITEMFTSDCYLAFAHHFKIPYIAASSCMLMPWSYQRFGQPLNPAFIPDMLHDLGIQMTFWERVRNSAYVALDHLIYEYLYHRPTERIARKYFKDLPPLKDMTYNTSMMFVNSHFSMISARPHAPSVVEVAGIHLPSHKPLPKDLQEFLDGGKDGVIYFNMGSMIRATSLPAAKRQAFLDAFKRLGKRVLWKWEESMPGQPPNLKTSKWMPQYDVLRHPNVRVYIGHGGMLGSIEAAYAAVPMVAIPIFGDQRANVHNLVKTGLALRLDYERITADSVYAAITEVLENSKYREAARRVSRSIRDRPTAPLDAAVYWTEYVIRHAGAPQLRSIGTDLSWYQRWLLDVAVVALAALALVFWLLRAVVSRLLAGDRAARKLKGE